MLPFTSGNILSINKIQRYVLYLASVILVFSLFFDTKIVKNSIVQKGAFAFAVIGLVWWVVEEVFGAIMAYIDSSDCGWGKETKRFALIFLTGLWFAVLFIGILLGVSLLFPRFLSSMSVWG